MSFINQVLFFPPFFSFFHSKGHDCYVFCIFFSPSIFLRNVIAGVHFLLWHFFLKGILCLLVLRGDC